jgi:hypothetical protein
MSTELGVRYSNLVDIKLRADLVTIDTGTCPVFNTRYEGSPKAGAVKIPLRDVEATSSTYDHQNGVSLTVTDKPFLTVTSFNENAINELVDGYEAAALPDDIVADRLDSAGYVGALNLDTDAITVLEAAATVTGTVAALSATTVYSMIVDLATAMTKAKVPATNRWLIVSPDIHGMLLKDTTNFIRQGDMSQQLVSNGYIGMVAGFAVKVSPLLDAKIDMIGGHSNWCHRIREWVVAPRVQSLEGDGKHIGACAVQGRWIYKHVVSKPTAIVYHRNAAAA